MTTDSLHDLEDEVLVERAQAGQTEAFEVLVHRHSSRVYGVTFGMMRNRVDAQDAAQDAFLNAWRRIGSFRGDARFSSWLYRIATNACLMKMRSRRRRPEVPLELQVPGEQDGYERPVEDLSPRIDELYESRELGAVILDAMDQLPDNYRAVFVLADLQEKSMKEVASILDLTVPNVKTRLHRARLKLREHLSDYLAAEPVVAKSA